MTLSRRGDYVTRAAISLARAFDGGDHRKIRELVGDTEIPTTFAAQILGDLVRAGLAESKAGKQGGYRLSREPDQITILEVIEAGEGPLRPEHCALGTGPCRWEQVCPLHETWSAASTGLRSVLAETSLAEVAERDLAMELGVYPTPEDSHREHPTVIDITDRAQVELSSSDARAALGRLPAQIGFLLDASAAEASLAREQPMRRRTPPDRYLVTWRVEEPVDVTRFEGEMTVSPVDDQRCELELAGSWHRANPRLGDTPAETRQHARQAVRRFLRNLTRELEAS